MDCLPRLEPQVRYVVFRILHHTYSRFNAESPIIHMQVLGKHIYIVNDADTAKEIFETRSKIYSDKQVVNFHTRSRYS